MKQRHSAEQIVAKLRQADVELGKGLRVPQVFAVRGAPQHVRSDNGSEFIAKEVQRWLDRAAVRTLYIQKASPWENGYVESFNGKLRDELLNRELFLSLTEARYVLDEWQLEYNHHRPHSGINWQTPAAFAACCEPSRTAGLADATMTGMTHRTNDVTIPATGVFPAASLADPPVGATPLPPAQPANHSSPILS